jgi:hypothetical protein
VRGPVDFFAFSVGAEACYAEAAHELFVGRARSDPSAVIASYSISGRTVSIMTTQEVANKLVSLCSEGKFMEATETLYSPDIVSIEAGAPPGTSPESKGIEAVKAKGKWWAANHDVHSSTVEGPLVAASHFAVTFKIDVTFKPQSRRFTLEEVAVYKVDDGKIVYEQFFYNM